MAENEGQPASGDEARPQETVATPAPRNDAEAAAQETAAKEAETKAKAETETKEGEQKPPKRNRTGEYINRQKARIKELESALQALHEKTPTPTPEPTLEQANFDPAAHNRAMAEWAAKQAVNEYKFTQQQESAQRHIQEVTDSYNAKVAEFAASHPDFAEKVTAIPYFNDERTIPVQLAIQAHEQGPEIAYAIAQDDDLAFQLASIQPHLAAAAVDRIASRLTAAPEVPQSPQPVAPQAIAKPVSNAPPPVPTVSGKTPTDTPPEKLTDAQWWARRQKRAS